jgi:hypothetical protein
MKLGTLAMLSAAALIAGGMTIAAAQSTMSPNSSSKSPGAAVNQGKCWDAASNSIRDMSANKNQTASGTKKPGAATTGSAPTGAATQSSGPAGQRPAAAAGLPNC